MYRRAFMKHAALAAAAAALSSPLAATGAEGNEGGRLITVVSARADETGYVDAPDAGDLIRLGSDRLENFRLLAAAIAEHRGATFCGLVAPSDYALLQQAAMPARVSFVSEITHMPTASGTHHTESTLSATTMKKVFDHIDALSTDRYGMAVSAYHTVVGLKAAAVAKRHDFTTGHFAQNAFVSFVFKA
ncbi:twin-arginine translocation signal domain-containing protein [Sulfurimonas diazotrophicus]|uniref:Twin-arginine translocation signal domain-containing protein n=1 Tax=Sulfurimonas diazotrophicus TaxID=3131939 RepID=A0ABZ3H6F7_9BACT